MRLAEVVVVSLLSVVTGFPNDDVHLPPQAPLPELVLQAKRVMVISEVGELAYDEAYKSLREWGHFELVREKSQADLTVLLQSSETSRPPRIRDIVLPYPYPFPYPYPYPYPYPSSGLNLWLIIVDSKTDQELWTDSQMVYWALREKNRKKDLILAVDTLFKRLQDRFPKK